MGRKHTNIDEREARQGERRCLLLLLTLSSVHGQLSHACPFLCSRRFALVTEAEGQSITITVH